uniref:Uncharacterized protein n=1 Tax=Romanomermis culicivorax TaxID=13658 RepID=A0A915HN24_ROMCU
MRKLLETKRCPCCWPCGGGGGCCCVFNPFNINSPLRCRWLRHILQNNSSEKLVLVTDINIEPIDTTMRRKKIRQVNETVKENDRRKN